jgi:phosphatidylglycerophosphate synthase
MVQRPSLIWLVQAISVSRLLASLVFATIALQDFSVLLIASIYGFAACTDLADGYVARKFRVTTFPGKVIDLISDKSLTVVSLLYAASRGISLLPLALLGAREIIVLGLRIIVVDGKQILPTSRVFGGLMAIAVWGNTLALIVFGSDQELFQIVSVVYGLTALIMFVNLIARLIASYERIKRSLTIEG